MVQEGKMAKITYQNWLKRGKPLVQNHRQAKWELGDWLLEGKYDETKDTVAKELGQEYPNWIRKAAEKYGYQYETFLEFRRVASLFPTPTRVGKLSWNHHRVVATVDDPKKRNGWLDRAIHKKWSVGELRQRVAQKASTNRREIDYTKADRKKLKDLSQQTSLAERHLVKLIVRWFISKVDHKAFVARYKKKEALQQERKAA
jgi:hypothetical protein